MKNKQVFGVFLMIRPRKLSLSAFLHHINHSIIIRTIVNLFIRPFSRDRQWSFVIFGRPTLQQLGIHGRQVLHHAVVPRAVIFFHTGFSHLQGVLELEKFLHFLNTFVAIFKIIPNRHGLHFARECKNSHNQPNQFSFHIFNFLLINFTN